MALWKIPLSICSNVWRFSSEITYLFRWSYSLWSKDNSRRISWEGKLFFFFLIFEQIFTFNYCIKNEFIHSTDMFRSVVLFSPRDIWQCLRMLSYCHDRQVLGDGGAMGLQWVEDRDATSYHAQDGSPQQRTTHFKMSQVLRGWGSWYW